MLKPDDDDMEADMEADIKADMKASPQAAFQYAWQKICLKTEQWFSGKHLQRLR